MAISFKSDADYGYSLLTLFGISSSLITEAKAYGITVDQSSPGQFVVKYNGTMYGSVTVKGSAISLAKSGSLGPASKEALRFQFEGALQKARAAAQASTKKVSLSDKEVIDDVTDSIKAHPAPKASMKDVLGKTTVFVKAQVPNHPPVTSFAFASKPVVAAKLSKANPVSLDSASDVCAPVFGTTSGSIYFVVALLDGLNISARYLGGTLSIRAAGSKLPSYTPALELFGVDSKGGYSSAHYDVSSKDLAKKTLGALVGCLGFGNVLKVADLDSFLGGQQ